MSDYSPRIADQLLSESLEALGAVLVQGAKWCGKTTTSVHHAKNRIFHSGTGRFDWITMRTMSLWESGDSTGDATS